MNPPPTALVVDDAPTHLTTFADLGVPAPIVATLAASGIERPFPIQVATLSDSLGGRDVIGRGRTGSGKTIAFTIPVAVAVASSSAPRTKRAPRALILVPTRELAAQVARTLIPIADAMRQRVVVVHGGVGAGPQISGLLTADVVIATPGRLEDLIAQRHCRLDRVEVTVLDEADHLADLGFLPAVKRLLEQTPADGQRLLFSATLDHGIDGLVTRFLHDPAMHSVDPAESPVPEIEHHFLEVAATDKAAVVRELASGAARRLLFTRTKHGAKKLTKQLCADGVRSVEMHGNLSQSVRTRNLEDFSSGWAPVLVATDIAARGLHIDDIELVVHVDPPAEHKAFLHRSGRTARAGAGGVVVTIVTPAQRRDVDALARRAGIDPQRSRVAPGDDLLSELRGAPADPVAPPRPRREQPTGAPRQRATPGHRRGAGPKRRRPESDARTGGGDRSPRTDRTDRTGRTDGSTRTDGRRGSRPGSPPRRDGARRDGGRSSDGRRRSDSERGGAGQNSGRRRPRRQRATNQTQR